jgi:hypothetical protein
MTTINRNWIREGTADDLFGDMFPHFGGRTIFGRLLALRARIAAGVPLIGEIARTKLAIERSGGGAAGKRATKLLNNI